mmetsp:Transcript_17915/g.25519  ORF Transcript_17915/g.25519 Transcript_17915/m.25519 type:complete len:91 (-) Transcript_17915:335-607(-)
MLSMVQPLRRKCWNSRRGIMRIKVPLQLKVSRRGGPAVEPEGSKENGINHCEITLSQEMQEVILKEKYRLEFEENHAGIIDQLFANDEND